MSVVTLHGWFMRHQSPVCSRARSEYFYARAVCVQLHTRAFLKFKASCTVVDSCNTHASVATYSALLCRCIHIHTYSYIRLFIYWTYTCFLHVRLCAGWKYNKMSPQQVNTRNKINCMGTLILVPTTRFHDVYNDCIKLCRLRNTPCMYATKHADLYNKT